MRKEYVFLLLGIAFIPLCAFAASERQQVTVRVAKEETVTHNYIRYAPDLIIEGTMAKDVIVAGNTITISGPVAGDVLVFGSRVRILGDVSGNVRGIADILEIDGAVGKNVNVVAKSVLLGAATQVGWDELIGAQSVEVRGVVHGDIAGAVTQTTVAGSVGGNMSLALVHGGGIMLLPQAHITGNVRYSSPDTALTLAEGSVIEGTVQHTRTPDKEDTFSGFAVAVHLLLLLAYLFGMLVVGMVCLHIAKPFLEGTAKQLYKTLDKALWHGIAVTVLSPLIALALLLTIIGIPLGLLMLAGWVAAMYFAKIVVAHAIGKKLLPNIPTKPYVQFAGGAFVLVMLMGLPTIGWILKLLTVFVGMGSLWLYVRKFTHHTSHKT